MAMMKMSKTKPGLKASTKLPTTGMIGGTSNTTTNKSSAKSGRFDSFAKGGAVKKR